MQSLDRNYLSVDYRDRLLKKRTNETGSVTKKTVKKLGSDVKINHLNSDSASLSIREESFAKKHFFELLMNLDEAISIVSTVLSSIKSAQTSLNDSTQIFINAAEETCYKSS